MPLESSTSPSEAWHSPFTGTARSDLAASSRQKSRKGFSRGHKAAELRFPKSTIGLSLRGARGCRNGAAPKHREGEMASFRGAS